MDRHLIERWTDTTTFGAALVFAGTLALQKTTVLTLMKLGAKIATFVPKAAKET